MTLKPGTRLGAYEIIAPIGAGGMGEVYRATDTKLGRDVALKVLPPEMATHADCLERFQREAKTVAALSHPNIVTIHSVEEAEGVRFLTMELVEGESLDHGLSAGGLPLARVFDVGIALSDALAAAHEKRIIHRDLKPTNIMVTVDGRVKVLDFGLAKLALPPQGGPITGHTAASTASTEMLPRDRSLTDAGLVVGTVPYMSPEQVKGQPLDSRTDIFSLGVVLYELATGRRPFGGSTAAETISSILRDTPRPVAEARQDAPRHLGRIIDHCLRKEPQERFQTARDVHNELRDLRKEIESDSAGVGAAPVVPRSSTAEASPILTRSRASTAAAASTSAGGRKRWLWAVAGTAAVIVAVAVLWIGAIGEKPSTQTGEVALPGNPSLAVLPFQNLSAVPDSDYFSAGMTEEIITKLSRIDHLEVAARGSVAPFTDPTRDVYEIGRVLKVRYLLDGSVRRAGDRVRVSVQLVDGKTSRILWSEDFDGTLEDVFAMQDQTAMQIADHLNVELSPEEQREVRKGATRNVAAYDAYLRGMALLLEWGSRDSIEQAIKQFERAMELDPNYAAALASLASAEADLYRNFDSSEERIQRAERLAQRAIEIDPTIPEASHALAMVAGYRYDYLRAAKLLREALRLAPKEARYWDDLSWALGYQTPPAGQGAVDAALKAIKLQPRYPGAYYELGRGLLAMGRYDEAREAFETSIEQDSSFAFRDVGMAQYYLAVGDYEKALAAIEETPGHDSVMKSYYRAAILAASGSTDGALESLQGALDRGFRDFTAIDASPHFASLRADPRYQELLRRYRH